MPKYSYQTLPYTVGAMRAEHMVQMADKAPILVIAPNIESAEALAIELRCFAKKQSDICLFPDWETLPYDGFSPQNSLINQRLSLLARILNHDCHIMVVAINTVLTRILPKSYFLTTEFHLRAGQTICYDDLINSLHTHGYNPVSQVQEPGEFATRGSLIDLYPSTAKRPYRIDLWDNEIESIKCFDPESQRSMQTVAHIDVLGASEYPMTPTFQARFCHKWQQQFPQHSHHDIPMRLHKGQKAGGAEYFLPLFFDQTDTLLDYIPANCQVLMPKNIHSAIDGFHRQVRQRYNTLQNNGTPCLPPEQVFLTQPQFNDLLKPQQTWCWNDKISKAETNILPAQQLITPSQDTGNIDSVIAFHQQYPTYRLLLVANNQVHYQLYATLLEQNNCTYHTLQSFQDFIQSNHPLCLTQQAIHHGFIDHKRGIALLTTADLNPQTVQNVSEHAPKRTTPSKPNVDIRSIKPGDYVIHTSYGIGCYLGLTTMEQTTDQNEYVQIAYADGDRLYIPISECTCLFPYKSPNKPELAKLGSKKWQKTQKRAIEKMVDSATELLELYSKREAIKAKHYQQPDTRYYQFCAEFPYEPTADQIRTIEAIITSLCGDKLTDHLICGDVGFGKTEIAMRAAFLAVISELQVVLIAPTTVLAAQHFQSFTERFARWPMQIDLLSGANSTKQNLVVCERLASGSTNIVIATHKALSSRIQYHNLGLLIIDEEHRFGVRQKEQLKNLKLDVDVLALTATPIPRTLQLAYSELRDLSIISTPPNERLPVKTYVSTFSETMVTEAIYREMNRSGQVYYLYNDVAKIEEMAAFLQRLIPELRIEIAHGQMPKKKLEKAMLSFQQKRAHLCLCSTIIEAGIDIANANTIIIDRADKLGLAQLHQLRGRVGRSHHQGYAYLFAPERQLLSNDANMRLDAISKHSELGSGFQLAIMDMEIRGAGELLGDEQSGHVKELGFDYMMHLIQTTTTAIRANQSTDTLLQNTHKIDLSTSFPIIIPKDYISDPSIRLSLYRRIHQMNTVKDCSVISAEIADIYGKLPLSVSHLIQVTWMQHIAEKIGTERLHLTAERVEIIFIDKPALNTEVLLNTINRNRKQYRVIGANKVEIQYPQAEIADMLYQTTCFLTDISLCNASEKEQSHKKTRIFNHNDKKNTHQ